MDCLFDILYADNVELFDKDMLLKYVARCDGRSGIIGVMVSNSIGKCIGLLGEINLGNKGTDL